MRFRFWVYTYFLLRSIIKGERCGYPGSNDLLHSNGYGGPFQINLPINGKFRGDPGPTGLLHGRGCQPRKQIGLCFVGDLDREVSHRDVSSAVHVQRHWLYRATEANRTASHREGVFQARDLMFNQLCVSCSIGCLGFSEKTPWGGVSILATLLSQMELNPHHRNLLQKIIPYFP